jgi:hypothetical protein
MPKQGVSIETSRDDVGHLVVTNTAGRRIECRFSCP